jgi:ketosteroid isomerase-like protein
MSTEANKAVVRRYVEAFNKQNRAVVEELFAPNLVWHVWPAAHDGQEDRGREGSWSRPA